jgi:hypothetical protein
MNIFTDLLSRLMPAVKEGEKYLLCCPNCSVIRDCSLIHYKIIDPLESLPEGEKKELKDYVIKKYPGYPVPELVERCKIIYSITNLL